MNTVLTLLNMLLSLIITTFSLTSAYIVLLLLLHVMSQIFPKRPIANIFSYYIVPGILFIVFYHCPRIFHHGELMPYYYLFICFISISIIWSSIFLEGKINAKLPYLFYYFAVYKCIVFMFSWFYSKEGVLDYTFYHLMCMLLSAIEMLILYAFTRIYIRHPFLFLRYFNAFQTVLLLFCPISFFLLLQLADPSIRVPYMVFLPVAASCLLINLPIFYYLYVTAEEQYQSRYDLEKALAETSAQLTRYRYTILIEEQARKERHELKNKYFYLLTLLNENKLDQLKEYIQKIIGDMSEIDLNIYTDNVLINHVLNTRLSYAHEKNIKTYTEIIIPKETKINEEYFCTILLNLLDNAIENSLLETLPDIHVLMSIQNGYLVCTVMNRVSKDILQDNPTFSTSKKDKKNHGLGLKIINSTVKKANAIFDISMKSGYFVATIMMPIEKGLLPSRHPSH